MVCQRYWLYVILALCFNVNYAGQLYFHGHFDYIVAQTMFSTTGAAVVVAPVHGVN